MAWLTGCISVLRCCSGLKGRSKGKAKAKAMRMRAVDVDCATRITVSIKAITENSQKLGAFSVSVSYSNQPLSLLATSLFFFEAAHS